MAVINDTHFYHSSIRNITAAFGNIFNNISIKRVDDDGIVNNDFKVPVGFGSKQHWYARIERGIVTEDDDVQIAIVVPRIGYMLRSGSYDTQRKLNSLQKNKLDTKIGQTGTRSRNKQYVPVPWKFEFELSVYAKNLDDGLQIVEQFIPYFKPTVNLRFLEIKELDLWNDIQVAMSPSMTINDAIEDGFTSRRTLTFDFSFTVSSNLYPPVTDQKVITKSIVDIDNLGPIHNLELITVEANPLETSNVDNSTTTIQIDQ